MPRRTWTAFQLEIVRRFYAVICAGETARLVNLAGPAHGTKAVRAKAARIGATGPRWPEPARDPGAAAAAEAEVRRRLAERGQAPNQWRERKCLCCTGDFMSEHVGNRICGKCRATVAWQSADAGVPA